METQKPTIVQSLKGGIISGVIAASLNLAWNIIAQSIGTITPPNFTIAIIMSSILPLALGSVLYFLLVKFTANGKMIFLIVSGIFMLVSFYGPMQPVMPDGSSTPEGFVMLTIPMHIIASGVAMWGIPKFAK